MAVNPTDKPELPTKVEDIKEYQITIPITTPGQLVDTSRLLREIYYFDKLPKEWIEITPKDPTPDNHTKHNLPPNLEELTTYINNNIPTISTQVPISNYDTAPEVINKIQEHFNVTLIPNYLINLPDLPHPEWDIFDDSLS
jgi:hypothetical protein